MGRSTGTKDIDSMGSCISVKLPNGQSLPITLHKFDQISKVYKLVSTDTGSREELIRIKFTGKVLKKNQTASSLGIIEGMVLKAEVSFTTYCDDVCFAYKSFVRYCIKMKQQLPEL